jgi:3-oxoacyl-[acyl-carrier protein] reductase
VIVLEGSKTYDIYYEMQPPELKTKADSKNLLLNDKRAVIFGAAGGVGRGIAKEFAAGGAAVFLSGRTFSPVNDLASEIINSGGTAHAEEVDALNELAVNAYVDRIAKDGSIDILLNAIGQEPKDYGNATPPLEVTPEQFLLPLKTLVLSQFITARSVGRHMVKQRSGVIIFITANPSRGVAGAASIGAAFGAMESLLRSLAASWGPSGVRVVGIRSGPMVDTRTIQQSFEIGAKKAGTTKEQILVNFEQGALLRSSSTVVDTARVATFLASDYSRTITGAIINANSGRVMD